jgi:predicted nucleic acid-binding protein
MRAFFLDTNILLDFLADRKPYSDDAEIIFENAAQQKVELYVSAISFNNLYYIINKLSGHKKAIKLLGSLSEMVNIIPLDDSIIKSALASSFKDFEDAIQYHSAILFPNIEAIITRNSKDFKNSKMAIISPEIAVKLLQ